MDLMINGVYFHSDKRLEKTAQELNWLGEQFVKYVLVSYLIEATRYVLFLREVIIVSRAQGVLRV